MFQCFTVEFLSKYTTDDTEGVTNQCQNYNNERLLLFRKTRRLHSLNLKTLLYGRDTLSYDGN